MTAATPPQKSPATPPEGSSPRQRPDKKSVSFNETVVTSELPVSSSPSEDKDKVREDPNVSWNFLIFLPC